MNRPLMALAATAALSLAACGGGTGGSIPGPNNGGSIPGTAAASPVADPTPADTSGPRKVAIGAFMLNNVGRSVMVRSLTPHYVNPDPYETPGEGKECVLVKVLLTNGSNKEWSSPMYELAVVDSNGQKYDTDTCGPSDQVNGLVSGGHVDAQVSYAVPKGSPLNMTWTPNSFEPDVWETALR